MTDKTAIEAIEEAMLTICKLCKRLNPQHTGDPKTCDCYDIGFLRKALAAIEAEKPAENAGSFLNSVFGAIKENGIITNHRYGMRLTKESHDACIKIISAYHAEQCKACRYVKPIEEPPKCTRPYLECHARRDGLCLNVLPCLPLPEAPRV